MPAAQVLDYYKPVLESGVDGSWWYPELNTFYTCLLPVACIPEDTVVSVVRLIVVLLRQLLLFIDLKTLTISSIMTQPVT